MIYNRPSQTMLDSLEENSIHAVITDPPYGIHLLGNDWDKVLPPQECWDAAFKTLKPGGFCLAFGHARLYHMLGVQLEKAGFEIKDCLCWCYATGTARPKNADKAIDKHLGVDVDYSNFPYQPVTDEAQQWKGHANILKTSWEPIIVAQKPKEGTMAENLLKWKVGALNIDDCRIPYASEADKKSLESFTNFESADHGDSKYFSANSGNKKQVNVHPDGRWPANLLWLDPIFADYDHIFMVPKPSQQEKRAYNKHDTVKPLRLMEQLITLVSPKPSIVGEEVFILDPFMGSGTTGVAAHRLGREFVGFELDEESFKTAEKRLNQKIKHFDIFER